jgi:glycerol-3-phosphate dehydrogenase
LSDNNEVCPTFTVYPEDDERAAPAGSYRAIVNAAGPHVDAHNALTATTSTHRHVFSKGIHLIVPSISPNGRVLTFFADDGRLFFVIPMGDRTCVGTTDTRVPTPETEVTDDDRHFVLDNINKRLLLKQRRRRKWLLLRGRECLEEGGGGGRLIRESRPLEDGPTAPL